MNLLHRSSATTLNNEEKTTQISSSDHYQNIDREEMKQFRQQWIDKWTDQAREISFEHERNRQRHRIVLPSFDSSIRKKKKKMNKTHLNNNNSDVVRHRHQHQTDESSSNDEDFQCRIS